MEAFLLNTALVLVREVESHRRHPASPTHQARLQALERDLRWVRAQLEQDTAATLEPATRRCAMKLPTRPVSDVYGYDRGTPIDRHYIEQFLAAHAERVRGHVAEVKDDSYARRFGGDRIRTVTVIDIDERNDQATLLADLAQPASLPEAAFDCIILTQTMQFFPNPAAALRNCHQALRPGGSLLLTAPAVGRVSLSTPEADCWRITPAGLACLLGSAWIGPVTVMGYGNLRACLGMLLGEATEELTAAELDQHDPGYPLVACALAER
ncbi:MAG: class I SAM-dependent methyltransferase [Egibacteraceae bacterium]